MNRVFFVAFALALLAGPVSAMTLTSPDIKAGQTIPQRFALNIMGCGGNNRQPVLNWQGVPPHSKALALALFDPDAPTSVGWVHWLLLRVPPSASSTKTVGSAMEGLTSFGRTGYGGPCPPVGDKPHHYIFTLYALDTDFPFAATTTYAAFRFTIRGHVLATAQLMGRYGRK